MLTHGQVAFSTLFTLGLSSLSSSPISKRFDVIASTYSHFPIQIHSVLLTLNPGSLQLWFTTKVKATLAQVLQLLWGEIAHGEQSHGVEWAITHTVSFKIQLSNILALVFCVQVASVVCESLNSFKGRLTHYLFKEVQLSDREGTSCLDLILQHLNNTSVLTIKQTWLLIITEQNTLGNIRVEVMNLLTQQLTQRQHECFPVLPCGVSQVQRLRVGRQKDRAHQLAGLRSVPAKLLGTTNRCDVMSIANCHLLHRYTIFFSLQFHLEQGLLNSFPCVGDVGIASLTRQQSILVGSSLIDVWLTKKCNDVINTQGFVDPQSLEIHGIASGIHVLNHLDLIRSIRH